MEAKKPNTKLISLGVLVAVVILVVAVAMLNKKEEQGKIDSAEVTAAAEKANIPATTTDTMTPPASTTMMGNSGMMTPYKAGTYTAEGTYQTPGGAEKIKITLTLSSDGTVTATTAIGEGTSPDSKEYQSRFISGYKSAVVGKNISSLNLGNISGSSLTPIGFNKAAVTIKSQATS